MTSRTNNTTNTRANTTARRGLLAAVALAALALPAVPALADGGRDDRREERREDRRERYEDRRDDRRERVRDRRDDRDGRYDYRFDHRYDRRFERHHDRGWDRRSGVSIRFDAGPVDVTLSRDVVYAPGHPRFAHHHRYAVNHAPRHAAPVRTVERVYTSGPFCDPFGAPVVKRTVVYERGPVVYRSARYGRDWCPPPVVERTVVIDRRDGRRHHRRGRH